MTPELQAKAIDAARELYEGNVNIQKLDVMVVTDGKPVETQASIYIPALVRVPRTMLEAR